MYPHKLTILLTTILFSFCLQPQIFAQQKPPKGKRIAVVVDERLSALRSTPDVSGVLIRRIGRGRFIAIRGAKKSLDGILFYRVSVSSRTQGWMQREAVVSTSQRDDDKRLFSLILSSSDFDRIARAHIFLRMFPSSTLRPQVLLLFAEAAEEAAARLTRDAFRRLGELDFSYYLNYSGLDRYNRQGIRFRFDRTNRQFHYDGAAWKELLKRYPRSIEAGNARERLANPNSTNE